MRCIKREMLCFDQRIVFIARKYFPRIKDYDLFLDIVSGNEPEWYSKLNAISRKRLANSCFEYTHYMPDIDNIIDMERAFLYLAMFLVQKAGYLSMEFEVEKYEFK